MRKLLIASLLALGVLSFLAASSQAQTGNIKGKITDKQTGDALPGATVVLEKTAHGAATDINGNFTVEKVPAGSYKIVARYIGYQSETKTVSVKEGETATVDFDLLPSSLTTNPVVVTAIGTQTSREKLGTAVSTVAGQSLVLSGAHDVITDLAGKAPGVYTTESSGDPGAATRIILRGVRSLQNNNQPLIVLDGMPIFSTSIGTGNVGNVSAISTLNDINPQDIQSVEIYKGPSAAAIWGSRAANGVIVITTKTGSFTPNRKVNISVRTSLQYDNLLREFPLQTSFGQGGNGAYIFNMSTSWGDRIADRTGGPDSLSRSNYPYATILQKNSKTVYDHAGELFHSPVSQEYGVTVSGGDQSGSFYLDVDRLGQNGIVLANQNFGRTSINANVSRAYADNIATHVNVSYINSSTDRTQQGSNLSGLLLGAYRTPADFNNLPYTVNYVSPTGIVSPNMQRTYRNGEGSPLRGAGYDNPFFTVYNNPSQLSTDRIIGSADISYDPVDWLDFTYRAGVDYFTNRSTYLLSYGDASQPKGQFTDNSLSQYQVNSDLQARAQHDFSSDFGTSLLMGFHIDQLQSNLVGAQGTTFAIPNAPPSLGNAFTYVPNESKVTTRNAAMYGELDLSLYQQLFFSFAGRDESSSTYGPSTAGLYFYPSASVAWEFTKLPVFQGNSLLTYGKLRAAIGTAANQPPVYSTLTYYIPNPIIGNGWGPAIGLQYYYGGALISNRMGNAALSPEMTSETEFGIDLRFFGDRLSLGATQYFDKTTSAVLSLDVAPSSGFTNVVKNAATLENYGTELHTTIEWLSVGQFAWSTNANWSQNRNKVTNLSGVKQVFLNGFTDPSSDAILNQPVGVLYGSRWERDASGKLVLDPSGFPQLSATPGVIGDPNPKWRAGIINTFRFQRFTLNVQFDIKQGGQVWNGTKGALSYFGKAGYQNWWTTISATQATTLKNFDGFTVAQMANGDDWGIAKMPASAAFRKNSDGTYSFRGYVQDFGGGPVIVDESYFYDGPGSGFTGPAEQFIEDGSYVRLRELSLSYLLPLSSIGIESVQFTLIGRNLALWTKYTGVDPETNLTGPSNGQGLDYFNNPSVKTWILSLQINY
ncbi:MAG: SusC/RagA family TonB-linked outer membrane protein [Bacteroidetes bacterium]|nr:SusC/RagA family TonB-linked outer membrane protein [Bacteroidota bacterium]